MPNQHLGAAIAQVSQQCIRRRNYASSTINLRNNVTNEYSKTVFIPRSKFPNRHDPKVELTIQEDKNYAHTYLDQDPSRKSYVIHDGPPFANGQIHIGHAINKILKDIAARYAMITGHRVEFITGWDCHGLPIEMQVLKLIDEQQRQGNYGGSLLLESTTSPEQFRSQARAFAKSQIDLQMSSFKRIGLLTDWNKRYTTDDPSYVANQLRAFSQLFEQKLIYKDLKPINWSIANQTTVADADIDYHSDHISKSAYILYEIVDPPFLPDHPGQLFYALIWTTTPWTLLENQAIAFNKQETYCIVKAWNQAPADTKNLLISVDSLPRVQSLLQRLGYNCDVKTYVPGKTLVGLKYKPLLESVKDLDGDGITIDGPRPFLDGDFVDGAKGTGLVHLAPNYGQEDFSLIKKNNFTINEALVDSSGNYCEGAGKILAGKHVFSDGNLEVLNLLDQHQALLLTENTQHSYPYETRTNQPILIRTSQQIFLDISRIVPRVSKALESSSFYPEHRRRQFLHTLNSSPNWCISRQRLWGTPIPVLYDIKDTSQAKMISHPLIIEHFCKLLYKRRFMDYWWTLNNDELIPQELLDKCKLPYKSENLVRGMDIFDVWSDSGLSWHTTINSLNDTGNQADLYLEGVDQIRGWFSASSILSIALRGCLPTKRFYLHGFALDENGRKMSKSQGNVVDPVRLFETYGVDPVRLWAARFAGDNCDIYVKPKEFNSSIREIVAKIRLTFRFLIGTLTDHDAIDGKLDHTKLELFDQFYLDKLYRFASTIDEHYKSYRYDLVILTIVDFISSDLSPNYINTVKDLLYCDELDSERRKSSLTVLNIAYNILMRCVYPLTPHIVHEAGSYMRPMEPLNEWQDLGYKAAWKNDVLHNQFDTIVKLKIIIGKLLGTKFEMMRDQDSILSISDKKLFKHLSKITNTYPDLMAELFKTSTFIVNYKEKLSEPDNAIAADIGKFDGLSLLSAWTEDHRVGGSISVVKGTPTSFEMSFKVSSKKKCPRCRRHSILDLEEILCDRCKKVLHGV